MARFDHLEIGGDSQEKREDKRQSADTDAQLQPIKMADRNRRAGQYENALRYYSRALEDDKAYLPGWVGQVEMLIALGEAPEADMWCRKALELFPGNGELLAARSRSLCRLGDVKQAGAVSDASMAAAGRSALRWTARGEWMLATRQRMAPHSFDKAQQASPDWLVPLEIALIYQHYRTPSPGLARARAATELAPDQPYPWFVRGCVELDMRMSRPAETSFRHCLELSPGNLDAKNRLEAAQRDGRSIMGFLCRLIPGR